MWLMDLWSYDDLSVWGIRTANRHHFQVPDHNSKTPTAIGKAVIQTDGV